MGAVWLRLCWFEISFKSALMYWSPILVHSMMLEDHDDSKSWRGNQYFMILGIRSDQVAFDWATKSQLPPLFLKQIAKRFGMKMLSRLFLGIYIYIIIIETM